jgi:hypothetical protein
MGAWKRPRGKDVTLVDGPVGFVGRQMRVKRKACALVVYYGTHRLHYTIDDDGYAYMERSEDVLDDPK